MLVQLVLGISLACAHGIPDREAVRQFVHASSKRAVKLSENAKPLEVGPHDTLRSRGPRDNLDGWTEGPLVG